MQGSLITVALSIRRVATMMIGIIAVVVALGFCVEAYDLLCNIEKRSDWLAFFSLSWEQNLPT